MKQFLFHLAVVIYQVYSNVDLLSLAVYVFGDVPLLGENVWIMFTSFITIWNIVLQQIYFIVCLIEDISRLKSNSKVIEGTKVKPAPSTLMFTRYVFPFALVVSVNFWIFYGYNPRQVDEFNVLQTHVTPWANHRMHTVIVLLVLAELWVKHVPYPKQVLSEIHASISLVLFYAVFTAIAQTQATIWIYPILGMLTWYEFLLGTVFNLVLVTAAYVTGKVLSDTIWGEPSLRQQMSFFTKTMTPKSVNITKKFQ